MIVVCFVFGRLVVIDFCVFMNIEMVLERRHHGCYCADISSSVCIAILLTNVVIVDHSCSRDDTHVPSRSHVFV